MYGDCTLANGGIVTGATSWHLAGNRQQQTFGFSRSPVGTPLAIPDTFNRFLSVGSSDTLAVNGLDINGAPVTVAWRPSPSGFSARGLFEDDGSVLGELGPNRAIVELDAFSEGPPGTSRFGPMEDAHVELVLRPSAEATFLVTSDRSLSRWVITRARREGEWARVLETAVLGCTFVAANDSAVAVLTLERVGETYDVWLEAFPY